MISPGKRKQGRPKLTLRNFFDGDFKEMELTWGRPRENFMKKKEGLSYLPLIESNKEDVIHDYTIL